MFTAIQCFEKIYVSDRSDARCLLEIIECYFSLNFIKRAEEYIELLAESDYRKHFFFAKIYIFKQNYKRAKHYHPFVLGVNDIPQPQLDARSLFTVNENLLSY
jgi:hypothetical protein